jgi:hypothetical protein
MNRLRMLRAIRALHASKILSRISASLAVFAFCSGAIASGADSAHGQTLASRKVNHYVDSAVNVLQSLGNAARKFDIPIGTELNDKLPETAVSIDVSDGTVADVISAILEHAPGYTWIEKNGVVDILPKENTNSILDLKIGHFKVQHATPNFIRPAIASLPEVKAWLSRNHVVERSRATASILIGADGKTDEPRVSLEMRNVTLREIMNSLIVKKGGPRSWSFSRYGDSNMYLNIDIG